MREVVETRRAAFSAARRVIVKVGTRVLVNERGTPELRRLRALVRDLADLHDSGREVVLVTSGAIGSGMEALGLKSRPKKLPELQMAAAVGQGRLMSQYERLFARRNIRVGQVLLTYDDLRDRVRHVNARSTMLTLLANRVIPIVNENDVVSVDEIKVGDNDVLASLVTSLIGADALILLSTTDGLKAGKPSGRVRAARVPWVEAVTERELRLVFGKESALSTGGMASKLRAAQVAIEAGAISVIADGRMPRVLSRLVSGEDLGTFIGGASRRRSSSSRKMWIAYFNRPRGTVVIDDGACDALTKKGKSLLPAGVRDVEGRFRRGALLNIRTADGSLVARGLSEYSSDEIRAIHGKKTAEIVRLLGSKAADEIVHRDNMVIISPNGSQAW